MYEACEYFESANRMYYQGNLYNDEELFRSGDASIEEMNKRIIAHDSEVIKFNEYLSQIEAIIG